MPSILVVCPMCQPIILTTPRHVYFAPLHTPYPSISDIYISNVICHLQCFDLFPISPPSEMHLNLGNLCALGLDKPWPPSVGQSICLVVFAVLSRWLSKEKLPAGRISLHVYTILKIASYKQGPKLLVATPACRCMLPTVFLDVTYITWQAYRILDDCVLVRSHTTRALRPAKATWNADSGALAG